MALNPEAVSWSSIDTCVLDMDGTLLDLHFDHQVWNVRLPQRYSEQTGLELGRATEFVTRTLEAARGSLRWYCFDHWSEVFDLDMNALEHELQHLISVRPGAESFLQQLHAQPIRVVLATNAHRSSLSHKLAHTGIDKYFDDIVSSHDYGHAKEEPRFWQTLSERLTIEPKRTLFIDDNIAVLDSARRFGIEYLFAIEKPNSQGQRLAHAGYHCLSSFSEFAALGC